MINNTENVLNVRDYSYKTYMCNNYKSQIAYVENNMHKRFDNRTVNNTSYIYKRIKQYSADVLITAK